jgi:hypothetical protein
LVTGPYFSAQPIPTNLVLFPSILGQKSFAPQVENEAGFLATLKPTRQTPRRPTQRFLHSSQGRRGNRQPALAILLEVPSNAAGDTRTCMELWIIQKTLLTYLGDCNGSLIEPLIRPSEG